MALLILTRKREHELSKAVSLCVPTIQPTSRRPSILGSIEAGLDTNSEVYRQKGQTKKFHRPLS